MIEPKRYALLTFGKEAKMVVASESLAEVTTTYVPWADYLALRAEYDELQVMLLAANDLVRDELGCTLAECADAEFPILAAGLRKVIQ